MLGSTGSRCRVCNSGGCRCSSRSSDRSARRTRCDSGFDVLLANASTHAGAGNGAQINVVIRCELANDGRDVGVGNAIAGLCSSGRRSGNGCCNRRCDGRSSRCGSRWGS